MISYEEIYKAAENERYSNSLRPIPKNFIKEVSEYLKSKSEAASREGDVFSDFSLKTKKQLENANTLFRELLRHRRRKILNLVLTASEIGVSNKDFENMLLVEKSLFESLLKCIEENEKEIASILRGEGGGGEKKNILILFLNDVDKFVGPDNVSYGPYSSGQIANLPREIASILVSDGFAENIEK